MYSSCGWRGWWCHRAQREHGAFKKPKETSWPSLVTSPPRSLTHTHWAELSSAKEGEKTTPSHHRMHWQKCKWALVCFSYLLRVVRDQSAEWQGRGCSGMAPERPVLSCDAHFPAGIWAQGCFVGFHHYESSGRLWFIKTITGCRYYIKGYSGYIAENFPFEKWNLWEILFLGLFFFFYMYFFQLIKKDQEQSSWGQYSYDFTGNQFSCFQDNLTPLGPPLRL